MDKTNTFSAKYSYDSSFRDLLTFVLLRVIVHMHIPLMGHICQRLDGCVSRMPAVPIGYACALQFLYSTLRAYKDEMCLRQFSLSHCLPA